KGEALLVANDYRRFNYIPYAYRTTNYGKTWTRIVDAEDVESYALSIIEDPIEKNLLFLGTDDGLYISFDAGSKWTKWTNGFPTVSVKDLIIHPREHDLIIGTFGRAAWVLDDIRPLRAMAKTKELINQKLELFEPPTAYQAAYQQPTGSRFGADAMYHGENRGYGARLSYFVKIDEKIKVSEKEKDKKEDNEEEDSEEKDNDDATSTALIEQEIDDTSTAEKEETKVKWDSIHLKIYDGDRLIRTLKQKAPDSTGLYKWTWYLEEAGVDYPSKRIRKRTNEPGGVAVKPGNYKLVMHFGDQTSEEMVTVKSDPRVNTSMVNINQVYDASKRLEGMQQTAADAVKQLIESKTIAKDYQSRLSKLDKKKHKDDIKASKAIIKNIDSIVDQFLGKEDKRQGITRNPEVTVMQRLGQARQYVGSRQNGITTTETTLIKNAKDALESVLTEMNTFFNDNWKPYQSKMEQVQPNPFKEIKTFKLD
ncbi:MAG: hypothetical protein ACI9YE_003306, partial [Psychroserpens sp.]